MVSWSNSERLTDPNADLKKVERFVFWAHNGNPIRILYVSTRISIFAKKVNWKSAPVSVFMPFWQPPPIPPSVFCIVSTSFGIARSGVMDNGRGMKDVEGDQRVLGPIGAFLGILALVLDRWDDRTE